MNLVQLIQVSQSICTTQIFSCFNGTVTTILKHAVNCKIKKVILFKTNAENEWKFIQKKTKATQFYWGKMFDNNGRRIMGVFIKGLLFELTSYIKLKFMQQTNVIGQNCIHFVTIEINLYIFRKQWRLLSTKCNYFSYR